MPKYKIKYGFSRPDYEDVVEAENIEEAETVAYELAMELAFNEMVYHAEEMKDDEGEED